MHVLPRRGRVVGPRRAAVHRLYGHDGGVRGTPAAPEHGGVSRVHERVRSRGDIVGDRAGRAHVSAGDVGGHEDPTIHELATTEGKQFHVGRRRRFRRGIRWRNGKVSGTVHERIGGSHARTPLVGRAAVQGEGISDLATDHGVRKVLQRGAAVPGEHLPGRLRRGDHRGVESVGIAVLEHRHPDHRRIRRLRPHQELVRVVLHVVLHPVVPLLPIVPAGHRCQNVHSLACHPRDAIGEEDATEER
mmetsp:Transcript_25610/g.54091  ORF Transcript_25610/g.54091 Transcript_25610/m.54091 type:complete len:246 (+) Transcript_25610:309-1046(+)